MHGLSRLRSFCFLFFFELCTAGSNKAIILQIRTIVWACSLPLYWNSSGRAGLTIITESSSPAHKLCSAPPRALGELEGMSSLRPICSILARTGTGDGQAGQNSMMKKVDKKYLYHIKLSFLIQSQKRQRPLQGTKQWYKGIKEMQALDIVPLSLPSSFSSFGRSFLRWRPSRGLKKVMRRHDFE